MNTSLLRRPRALRPLILATALAGAAGLALPAQAADWVVDPAASTLGFSGVQSGDAFKGTFGKWTAEISFDPAAPEKGHAKVTIDVASAKTGDAQKDGAMPEADWFDAASHPRAVFEARSFRATGGNAYEAAGTLTIRDTSHDVTLPVTIAIEGDKAHATGKLTLVRTDYGVGQGAWASDQYVGVNVDVTFDITATRKP
ncbi:YceI family protein [Pseudoxanthobacter sp.]|uniref:YceI family protein n=1 Tax=Pseudoxanthobacter sp. TaxID=1925742 RepID=UPI002FE240C3